LKKPVVTEVEPEAEEIEAYIEGMRQFRKKEYSEWNKIKGNFDDLADTIEMLSDPDSERTLKKL